MLRKVKKDKDFVSLKRTIVAVLHGGYWLLYLLLLVIIFSLAGLPARKAPLALPSVLPLIALCIVPNLIAFYSFYLLLFDSFFSRQKVFSLIARGIPICLVSAALGLVFSLAFFGVEQAIFENLSEFFSITIVFTIIAGIHGAIALVIRGFLVWFDEIKLKEELAHKNFEVEMALVKSQINPHFLFNTINNIDVLISKDAAKASAYLNKLSGILRYMVYETKSEKNLLSAELGYIEKYLELEKIRTVNPDYVRLQIVGEAKNITVAPMIFFPFIENAFKHTENNKKANLIQIKFFIENNQITFECENSYQKNEARKSNFGGLGNELIKKRLSLLYPQKHLLDIIDGEGIYKVELILQIEQL